MSSSSSTRSTTPVPSTSNPIFDLALAEYSKHTGQDLLNHPQAAAIDRCESLDSIVSMFQEQCRAFDEFSGGDPKLIKWLEPIVFKSDAIGRSAALHAGATLVSPTELPTLSTAYFNAF